MNTKLCHSCNTVKGLEEFHKNKSRPDGRGVQCKECTALYRSNHREDLKAYAKVYYSEHKKEKKVYRQGRLEEDREYRMGPASFENFKSKLTVEEDPKEGPTGELLVRCAYCRDYFTPTLSSTRDRMSALLGRHGKVEGRLYCCEEHKSLCDVYNSKSVQKSVRRIAATARCNQGSMKKAMLSHQVDEVGYTYCEKCGSSPKTLDLHHTIPVASNYGEADNSAHQLLLCKPCHLSLHKDC